MLKLSGQQVSSLEMLLRMEVLMELQDSYLVRLVLTSPAELVYLVLSHLYKDYLEQQGLLPLAN